MCQLAMVLQPVVQRVHHTCCSEVCHILAARGSTTCYSPAATPSGPDATSQAAAGSASIANVISALRATSAGLAATCV